MRGRADAVVFGEEFPHYESIQAPEWRQNTVPG
jgi:hypothetical protein